MVAVEDVTKEAENVTKEAEGGAPMSGEHEGDGVGANEGVTSRRSPTALVLGAGFLGCHLAARLKSEGRWVRAVDIKETPRFWEAKDICDEYMQGDLTDPRFVSTAVVSPFPDIVGGVGATSVAFDEVYLVAADEVRLTDAYLSGEHDAEVLCNCATIVLTVLAECQRQAIKRLFFASSAAVYSGAKVADGDKEEAAGGEEEAYVSFEKDALGWACFFCERAALAFGRNFGMDVRVGRVHEIFGPRGEWRQNGVAARRWTVVGLCRTIAQSGAGSVVSAPGQSEHTASCLYVDDAVDAILLFMRQDGFAGPVDIGSAGRHLVLQLLERTAAAANKRVSLCPDQAPRGPAPPRGRCASCDLCRRTVGIPPPASVERGIAETYEWIAAQVSEGKAAEELALRSSKLAVAHDDATPADEEAPCG
jgi:GDP-D-mannose 3',5'-epimerase